MKKLQPEKYPNSFALVITLIMVVLAAVIAIGVITTASLDRTTARSADDRFQALLAAKNGLEAAKQALTTDGSGNLITQDDMFVVTRVAPTTPAPNADDSAPHYYFIANLSHNNTTPPQVTYYPLYSGGPAPAAVSLTTLPTYSLSDSTKAATNLPDLLPDPGAPPAPSPVPRLLPPITTQWIDVVSPNPAVSPGPKLRYCFWIEDLGGYIDAGVAGNTLGPGTTHTRDTTIMQPLIDAGTLKPGALVAMWTLFNPSSSDPAGTPQQAYNQGVVSQSGAFATSETVRSAFAHPTPASLYSQPAASDLTKMARHVVSGTHDDQEQLIIPYGFGYKDEGAVRTDINKLIKNKDVDGIAKVIKDNLQEQWATNRRGAFANNLGTGANDSYRHTIAANIISYAQPITDAPVVGTDYRGIGAFPLVNEFYDQIVWTRAYADATGDHHAVIDRWTFVELWNMTNQSVNGTLEFQEKFVQPMPLLGNPNLGTDPGDSSNGSTVTWNPAPAPTNVKLTANEFTVLLVGHATYDINNGPTFIADPMSMGADVSGTTYTVKWNGVVVDKSAGGVEHGSGKILYLSTDSGKSASQKNKWEGGMPGFAYTNSTASSGPFFDNPGDPRSAFYNTAAIAANDYSGNGSMWGRNQRNNINDPSKDYYAVRPSAWPDSGHDSSPAGPLGDATQPLPKPSGAPATDSTKPVTQLSGTGSLKYITELGNVYDPAQWNIPSSGNPPTWKDIDSSTSASGNYGGGFTLHVGRTEFTRFRPDGSRASQLLDLFVADKTTRETQGLINLNTATRETLRALGAGVVMNRDAAIQPSSLQNKLLPPASTDQADKFADAVINSRLKKPFMTTSQLSDLLDTSGSGFFGNKSEWSSSGPTEWNDTAAEEYFARIVDQTSVRSRNFRVFVTGQYVDPRFPDSAGNPKVLATAKKVYQVFLNPHRSSGAVGTQTADVTYEKDL